MGKARKPPKSYLNRKRPPIQEAMRLEGDVTIDEALKSLEKKGYLAPRPRPWQLGSHDRGLGRKDWAVLDSFGDLVAEIANKEDAELIITAVNAQWLRDSGPAPACLTAKG